MAASLDGEKYSVQLDAKFKRGERMFFAVRKTPVFGEVAAEVAAFSNYGFEFLLTAPQEPNSAPHRIKQPIPADFIKINLQKVFQPLPDVL